MTLGKKSFIRFSFPKLHLQLLILLKRILFLWVNAQYPSWLANLIMINCFVDCLMSLDQLVFIPSISQVSYVQTKYLLVTNKKSKSLAYVLLQIPSFTPIVLRIAIDAKKMNAFPYYNKKSKCNKQRIGSCHMTYSISTLWDLTEPVHG